MLRKQPGVDPGRLGFLGISQGGWVSYLAACMDPQAVSQVVAISGPGVSVAEQERYRLALAVDGDDEALAWVDERARRLIAGEDPASILADQRARASRPWYRQACDIYDIPELLPFLARNLAFDPATVLPDVRCPVFAAFGGADTLVPVPRSVAVLSKLLPSNPRHALAVFPAADHNLFTAEPDHTILLSEPLAPGFLPMLTSWFSAGYALCATPPPPQSGHISPPHLADESGQQPRVTACRMRAGRRPVRRRSSVPSAGTRPGSGRRCWCCAAG